MATKSQLDRIVATSRIAAAVLAAAAACALLAIAARLAGVGGTARTGGTAGIGAVAGVAALALAAVAAVAGALAALAAARAVASAARECRQLESAWQESEERFRALAEGSVDGVMTFDAAGRIVFANPAAERLLGYSETELLGRDSAVLLPEFLRPGRSPR